jgi:hypothetical protein
VETFRDKTYQILVLTKELCAERLGQFNGKVVEDEAKGICDKYVKLIYPIFEEVLIKQHQTRD